MEKKFKIGDLVHVIFSNGPHPVLGVVESFHKDSEKVLYVKWDGFLQAFHENWLEPVERARSVKLAESVEEWDEVCINWFKRN